MKLHVSQIKDMTIRFITMVLCFRKYIALNCAFLSLVTTLGVSPSSSVMNDGYSIADPDEKAVSSGMSLNVSFSNTSGCLLTFATCLMAASNLYFCPDFKRYLGVSGMMNDPIMAQIWKMYPTKTNQNQFFENQVK